MTENRKFLSASMMCADFGSLKAETDALEQAGVDGFHLDVMDGAFVPNFGMGLQDIEYLTSHAEIPCDIHLMIQNPGNYVEKFAAMHPDLICFHPEADLHPTRTLQKIKDARVRAGIAVNPGTSLETVRELLPLSDFVLIMTVNPGFAGQKYLEFVNEKIERFAALKEKYGFEMGIDGSCSPARIKAASEHGVDMFVLGTSALFGKGRPYADIIPELHAL